MSALGLDLTTGEEHFEVHALRVSDKQGPDEAPQPQILLSLVQERRLPGDSPGGEPPFVFSGGCTIIADQPSALVKYYVSKNVLNATRVERQRAFNRRLEQSLISRLLWVQPPDRHGGALCHAARRQKGRLLCLRLRPPKHLTTAGCAFGCIAKAWVTVSC